jgi:hypothetical protein
MKAGSATKRQGQNKENLNPTSHLSGKAELNRISRLAENI